MYITQYLRFILILRWALTTALYVLYIPTFRELVPV